MSEQREPVGVTGWDADQWQANATYWYEQAQEAYHFRDMAALDAEQSRERADALAARLAAVEADRDDLARLNDDKVERIADLRQRLRAALAADPADTGR